MIYVLLGKSCSGKTSVLNYLSRVNNLQKVTAVTTRPMRNDEVNGVDYHFIKDHEFLALQNNNELVCVREYTITNGDVWRYAILKDEIFDARQDKILVVDLVGFKGLKNFLNSKCKGIYLDVDDGILKERGLKRGDSLIELERRLKVDKIDFENVEKEVNYIISVDSNVEEIAKLIMNIVEAHEQ